MNIKDYIQSGVVECCVLGLATEAESREFEILCDQHPEIAQARKSFELALENQLARETIEPPAHLKAEILQSITVPGTNGTQGKEMHYLSPVRHLNIWKYITAACLLLVAGMSYWANSVNTKFQDMLRANVEVANQFDHASHAESVKALKSIVQKPSIKWTTMVEPANEGHCMAHVYWDTLSKNTFLLLGNIPKSVADKQFQLWAMLDNQPVNLGIFDIRKEGQLIKMKNISKAKDFTITIEPKGGSDAPNVKATYAVGQL